MLLETSWKGIMRGSHRTTSLTPSLLRLFFIFSSAKALTDPYLHLEERYNYKYLKGSISLVLAEIVPRRLLPESTCWHFSRLLPSFGWSISIWGVAFSRFPELQNDLDLVSNLTLSDTSSIRSYIYAVHNHFLSYRNSTTIIASSSSLATPKTNAIWLPAVQ